MSKLYRAAGLIDCTPAWAGLRSHDEKSLPFSPSDARARAAASFPVKPMMVGVRSSCEVMASHSTPPWNAG